MLRGAGAAGSPVREPFTYTIAATSTINVLTDLPAHTASIVSANTAGGEVTISIRPGSGMQTNAVERLSFTSGAGGQVRQ